MDNRSLSVTDYRKEEDYAPDKNDRFYIGRIMKNLAVFIRWGVFSTFVGLFVGAFSTLFAFCLRQVTTFRTQNPWIILLLPLAGVVIVFLYGVFRYKNDKGTNLVLSSIHAEAEVPFRMAPLIFISTIITHLFGGSAGREGAALQLGGSIGQQLGKLFRFDEKDQRIVVMCGMSAAFSAIFGTPDRGVHLFYGGGQRRSDVLCGAGAMCIFLAGSVEVCNPYGNRTKRVQDPPHAFFRDRSKPEDHRAGTLLCGTECDLLYGTSFAGGFLPQETKESIHKNRCVFTGDHSVDDPFADGRLHGSRCTGDPAGDPWGRRAARLCVEDRLYCTDSGGRL